MYSTHSLSFQAFHTVSEAIPERPSHNFHSNTLLHIHCSHAMLRYFSDPCNEAPALWPAPPNIFGMSGCWGRNYACLQTSFSFRRIRFLKYPGIFLPSRPDARPSKSPCRSSYRFLSPVPRSRPVQKNHKSLRLAATWPS